MALEELAVESLPDAARDALPFIEPAQRFLYEFTESFYNNRAFTRLRLEDTDISSMRHLLDDDGMSVRIVGVEDGPMPAAYLEYCATKEEEDEDRVRAMVEWRRDLGCPAAVDYTLPGEDFDELRFLFLKERPACADRLREILPSVLPQGVSVDVRNQGERIYFSGTQEHLLTRVLAKTPYLYLGELCRGSHTYGNCDTQGVLVRTSKLPRLLGARQGEDITTSL